MARAGRLVVVGLLFGDGVSVGFRPHLWVGRFVLASQPEEPIDESSCEAAEGGFSGLAFGHLAAVVLDGLRASKAWCEDAGCPAHHHIEERLVTALSVAMSMSGTRAMTLRGNPAVPGEGIGLTSPQ